MDLRDMDMIPPPAPRPTAPRTHQRFCPVPVMARTPASARAGVRWLSGGYPPSVCKPLTTKQQFFCTCAFLTSADNPLHHQKLRSFSTTGSLLCFFHILPPFFWRVARSDPLIFLLKAQKGWESSPLFLSATGETGLRVMSR